MSLALATMCRTNSITLSASSAETQQSKKKYYKLSPYPISVLAALGELSLGLPLDRIKIGLQSGSSLWEIIHPSRLSGFGNPRQQFKSNMKYWFAGFPIRVRTSMKYWFAGHTPSIINRCFIYLPGIAFLNTGYSNHIEPWICWAGGCPKPISQILVKPIVVSAAISPYVSLFEGLKLAQQLGHQKVYPQEINKFINKIINTATHNYPSTTSQAPTTQQPSTYQIIRGVINSGRPGILFASFLPTFARETAFISGMCAIQPQITDYLLTANTGVSGALFSPMMSSTNTTALLSSETARVVGSLAASFICQTISQPFDVLKTRRECNPGAKWSVVFASIQEDIKNKGTRRSLFSGWIPRCLRGVWTFYSVSVIRDWLS